MTEEEKIISYTTTEFLTNGFYKTSMDQLAKGMKISKKTIYKFFPSKSVLLNKVVSRFQNKIKAQLDEIVDSDKCLVDKLREVISFFAHFYLKINQKLLSDFFLYQPELWNKIETFRATVIETVWEKLIIEGKKSGIIIDVSNKIIIGIILSSIKGVINPKFLTENNIALKDGFEETFTILINGILTEKGKKEFENKTGI
jgi:AcrR family transcriptional regulator